MMSNPLPLRPHAILMAPGPHMLHLKYVRHREFSTDIFSPIQVVRLYLV